jgi:hypothetical protein
MQDDQQNGGGRINFKLKRIYISRYALPANWINSGRP